MKRMIFLAMLLLSVFAIANSQNHMIKAYYNADSLRAEWERFKADPSSDNALRVYNLLPEKGHVGKDGSDLELENDIFENLGIVEKEVNKENENCVKLAFRLFTISDGAFSEWLDMILGGLININPEMFLRELKTHNHLVSLPHLIGNYGPEFVDEDAKSLKETEDRIKSLESVKKDELLEYRNKCIDELNNRKKYYIHDDNPGD